MINNNIQHFNIKKYNILFITQYLTFNSNYFLMLMNRIYVVRNPNKNLYDLFGKTRCTDIENSNMFMRMNCEQDDMKFYHALFNFMFIGLYIVKCIQYMYLEKYHRRRKMELLKQINKTKQDDNNNVDQDDNNKE